VAHYFRHYKRQRRRGIALVIVLASLVLLAILTVAFLASIGTELQSSKVYANGSSVKLLAQSAVGFVIGQIQSATSDQTKCWASQPGMIRTYDTTGAAFGYYKLYSDATMQGTGAFDHTKAANVVPTNWYSQKGTYIDLNQPVSVDGTNAFPILDGNSTNYSTYYSSPLSSLNTAAATTSINTLKFSTAANLGANGLPGVTGFWLTSNTPTDPSSPNVAPMPVMWLYVLQNGAVLVPDTNPTNGIVTFHGTVNGGVLPTSTNPIVGRMAYWTDDETCKVNINTASEGTFWDTPHTYSVEDYTLASNQPVQNEFQRYPGHPATVSLSAVFNGFTADSGYPENLYSTSSVPSKGIAPRTTAGGSQEGTVATAVGTGALTLLGNRLYTDPDELLFQPSLNGSTPGTSPRLLNNALLSTPTELDATAIEKAKFFITADSEAPDVNVFNLPRVSMWPITCQGASAQTATPIMTPFDQLIAFCSTINNHIFYFQRWDPTSPVNDLPTTNDNVGLDRNRRLLEYLRTLTSQAIPGFGGNFASKYNPAGTNTTGDRDQILTEMFDYIRSTNLQDSTLDTATTPWAGKYAPGFNLTPATPPTAAGYTTPNPYYQAGIGQVVPILDQNISITDPVNPSGPTNNPRGFGRFPTVHQAALVFIGAGDSSTDPTSSTANPNSSTSYTPAVAANKQRVQAGFFLQMFDPSEGVAITRPWYQIKVTGLDGFQWGPGGNTVSMGFQSSGIISKPDPVEIYANVLNSNGGNPYIGYSFGGIIDWRQLFLLRGNINVPPKYYYPVYQLLSGITGITAATAASVGATASAASDMPTGGTFAFNGGSVTVEIDALNSSGGVVLPAAQTITIQFPSGTFPVPNSIDNNVVIAHDTPPVAPYPAASNLPTADAANVAKYDFLSFLDNNAAGTVSGRLDWAENIDWISAQDVVRGVVAMPGDIRLIAARQNVPSSFYQPLTTTTVNGLQAAADYNAPASSGVGSFSHMLRLGPNWPVYGASGGKLLNVSSTIFYPGYLSQYFYNPSTQDNSVQGGSSTHFTVSKDTDVPNQTTTIFGDWDTGVANERDGAFINKADEGDEGTTAGSTPPPAYYEIASYDDQILPGPTFFSPNRMIPSPGMFGSLPSQVWANKPWQTLLFRPGPAGHFGLGTPATGLVGPPYTSPPDHLLMDLFNMPVVEPYAISSPLATAGRINMNYLIVPFTYINRDTGLRAAMKSQMVTAIPSAYESAYKTSGNPNSAVNGSTYPTKPRYSINLDSTLSQFLARFYNISGGQGATGTPDIFHSASEICDIDLVPNDTTPFTKSFLTTLPITRTNMDKYWSSANNGLTGDNLRERPYANLYPLLTTKSNTFTVHFRVQTLKQALPPASASTSWNSWREGTDLVVGEYRGSQTVERYIDPNDSIPDYADPAIVGSSATFPPATPLSNYYKFRVVSTHQFSP
jgi:uncharacterized protein (TIGR02600 family)